MQKGRWEPRMPVVHDRLSGSCPSIEHAREVRVWMGSDTDDFMGLGVKTAHPWPQTEKRAIGRTSNIGALFSRALRSAASRVKSCHVSVNHG
jgi:hypothetical protein